MRCRTSSPSRSSVAASGPKILTATSALTPETTSSRRIAIGCVKFTLTPGTAASADAIASINCCLSRPVFHDSTGWRMT